MISRRAFLATLAAVPVAGVVAWPAPQGFWLRVNGGTRTWIPAVPEPGAFLQAMDEEIAQMIKQSKRELNRELYREGQRFATDDWWADAEIRRFQRERW